MLLKRKRSDDELSPFTSSFPLKTASPGDVATLDMDVDMDMDQCVDSPLSALSIRSLSRPCTPSHLPSRTFKRLRNGRPSDREVHQNTLQILYRAQQRPQEPQHGLSPQPAAHPRSPALSAPAQSQRSLHSFWNIPCSHQPQPEPEPARLSSLGSCFENMVDQPTNCGDCGVELGGEDAAVDDGYGFETYISSCSLCSKAVCFSCSVSNLGEQRRCLVCAGKKDGQKRWVGTSGWAPEPMSVY
ncbi:hypothetical protein DHEL01_v208619 [Diaporthe helianthi]|uniref:Uncharacterized protein n=1 Tax=Diaporthe helianthi TaxID=158607 RepID=A0A2P5HRU7_DIAHE|nr:hypothetical protein DHEL01_v208619 [Diaporthe helianthi]